MSARIADLPSALDRLDVIVARLDAGRPAMFLDYDGTLTPIVDDPAAATLSAEARAAVARLAGLVPLAIVSGRDLADVRDLVALDGLWYAGSHGFDIVGPAGERREIGLEALDALGAAESELRGSLVGLAGVRLERKRFAVTVHTRTASDALLPAVEAIVAEAAEHHPGLRRSGGKRVLELRPGRDWDKGRAVGWLLSAMGLDDPATVPVYVGDDETDEDAFRAVAAGGFGLVVRGERDDRPTAAAFALADTADVAVLLERVAGRIGSTRA